MSRGLWHFVGRVRRCDRVLHKTYCVTRTTAVAFAPHCTLEEVAKTVKKRKASSSTDPGPRLQRVSQYLEKNFPDFFAEARFQVGDDDFFLYSRFGQYLARVIETNRASPGKIARGFTVLNKMARASATSPQIRQMLVAGPLEYIVDAPRARKLASKRLSPVAKGYMESLCE